MQVSILLAAAVAATGVVADLHLYGSCSDNELDFKGVNTQKDNQAATKAACARYRKRNTGNKWWDTCPDCTTSFRGDVLVCNSLAKHIGGDEWDFYCRQSGAQYGNAS